MRTAYCYGEAEQRKPDGRSDGPCGSRDETVVWSSFHGPVRSAPFLHRDTPDDRV